MLYSKPAQQKVHDAIDWMLREELPDEHLDILKQWVDGCAKKVNPLYLKTRLSLEYGKQAEPRLNCVREALQRARKEIEREARVSEENLIRILCEDLELEIPVSP